MSLDVEALARRVAALEAAEAARACLYDYARTVDTRDWSGLRASFTDDAVMAMGPDETAGGDAIVASLQGMLPEAFITQHLIANPRVVANDGTTVVIDSTVYYLHEGTGFEASGWGSYRDTVVVTDGVGRIARKEFTPAQYLPGSIATAMARVRDLEVMDEARAATWRYATAVDTPDLDLLREVFTDDAVLASRSGAKEGRDAVIAYYAKALADPIGRKHLLANQHVEVVSPSEAIVHSYFAYTYAGDATSILGWGSYVDTVRIEDGIGRIAEKRITIDASGDVHPGWATKE
mgnify:CR=1 FL=1